MNYKEFGLHILLYRKRAGISQMDLANRAGISRNYLSMIENNLAHNLSVDVLSRLADAMEAEPGGLLTILINNKRAANHAQ